MIEVSRLRKSFGEPPTHVIKDLTFQIKSRDFVSIWGRSGSGKTTLLYLISTLDKPTSGQILIDGVDINQLSEKQLHDFRNQNIGFIFQFHYLLPELSALENVLLPAFRNQQQKKFREKAEQLLYEVGLKDKLNRLPSQLSGGEQQRVAIARSLILDPKYIFADEPTGSLDSSNGDKVMQLLLDAHERLGTTVILVTHEQDYANMAKSKIYLKDGVIVEFNQH